MNDKLTTVACWTPILQVIFTFVTALASATWALTTHTNEKARLQYQQDRERYKEQNDLISRMSRQLDMMSAQCPSEGPLRALGEKKDLTVIEKGCYKAYIEAVSFLSLAEARVGPQSTVNKQEWARLWKRLSSSLRDAGNSAYKYKTVSMRWKAIVEKSEFVGNEVQNGSVDSLEDKHTSQE